MTFSNIYDEAFFAKRLNGWKPLTILQKGSITDTWQGSKYASKNNNKKVYLGFKACHVMTS